MPGLFKTSNPALNENTFRGRVAVAGEAMTLQGTCTHRRPRPLRLGCSADSLVGSYWRW
jgi:hypothetical protein